MSGELSSISSAASTKAALPVSRSSPSDGHPRIAADDLPLQGVSADSPDTDAIAVVVGDKPDDHLTHEVQPTPSAWRWKRGRAATTRDAASLGRRHDRSCRVPQPPKLTWIGCRASLARRSPALKVPAESRARRPGPAESKEIGRAARVSRHEDEELVAPARTCRSVVCARKA